MKSSLSVNLNKIALIRNSRGHDYPNVGEFAQKCIALGAHGITLHPRPDQRHATYADVKTICDLRASNPDIEINIEGYPTDKFMEVVLTHKPDQCTLVPDDPSQLTSDHGWDVNPNKSLLSGVSEKLSAAGIRVSLFIDPDTSKIASCSGLNIERVELYTEEYASAFAEKRWAPVLAGYKEAAAKAQELDLDVNAGHDLNLKNLGKFLSTVPNIREVSIGHALIVESIEMGLETVIGKYLEIINS